MSSIQDTKARLAAAVSTVSGIKGYANRPSVLRTGDAFVRWRGWSRAEGAAGVAFQATYSVTVVLPSDEVAADTFAYDRADELEVALQPVMWIDSFEPMLMPIEGGDLFTLTITGRTE